MVPRNYKNMSVENFILLSKEIHGEDKFDYTLISKDNIQAALKSTYSITSVPEFNLTQAQSIHKCTGLPAHKLNLKTKGIIKLNNDADIVIWSKDTIESVIINGILVFHKDQLLNTNSGKILNI